MKLFLGYCLFFLLLSVLIPKETEAIGLFVLFRLRQLAARQGLKLWKMCFYSKCPTVGVPRAMKCPKNVFGIGTKKGQARFTAKVYAEMFGYKECDKYVGECKIFKFRKGPKCPKKVKK